ncbi:secretion protein HlyD family protein [Methylocaldum marinum]|uniref:Secretion protein HlyD family protein n=1 Tax=Methylocaldum marinum TaxID=1432792 RepID=A0A250KVL0_9GAMM|nr:HlyD family secretion protein [Methylocaldum marinum]BBA35713.1 secretion protein HlyD family protein [Methylocaldum marinum]
MKIHPKAIRARRNRRLLLVALAVLASAPATAIYWWVRGCFRVETDNAFVAGNLIPVEADATGIVTQVLAEETQFVNKGDLLVRLDEHRAHAALGQSEGDLGRTVRGIGALFATRRQLCQKQDARSAQLARVRHDVARFRQAYPNGSVSEKVLQNAEDQMTALNAELREVGAELQAIEAQVGGTSRTEHPEIEAAKHRFIDAYLDFVRQCIHAPVSGYVAKRKAQVGDRVHPGEPLLMLVPLEHLWVEANLRETELRKVRPGQSAEVIVDLYGRRRVYHGTVEGLVPGTGSVFALLPPDNATGNFIHIVQRVPVRIALRKDEILKRPIRPGLSTVTSIHIDEPGRPIKTSLAGVVTPEYATDIFANELVEAESRAQEIIAGNLVPNSDSLEATCTAAESLATERLGPERLSRAVLDRNGKLHADRQSSARLLRSMDRAAVE